MSIPFKHFRRESPPTTNFSTIITECIVSEAFNPTILPHPTAVQYNALWDTGATNTVITKKIATELNLFPRGKITSFHADGQTDVETYYINIMLPNNVGFQYLRVSEGKLKDFDVLIGMDIIAMGEFTLRHENQKHIFEFKLPDPDSVNNANKPSIKIGRNDPCPCKSGRKYKNCHGVGKS